jgi:hypothetical protein
MDGFIGHWEQCNEVLGASPFIPAVPGKPGTTLAAFHALRVSLLSAQTDVQGRLNHLETQRAAVGLQKTALMTVLTDFLGVMDGYYQATAFYGARPVMPNFGDGQDRFTKQMIDAMTLWEDMNAAAPPAGVTLPVVLASGVSQGEFASLVSGLQFAYLAVSKADARLKTARTGRTMIEDAACAVMKAYRAAAPQKLSQHPALVASIPRLTPEPGHTPEPVQASATYVAPSTSHVVHTASADGDLDYYELEGTNGEDWSEEDAVNLGRHEPGEANEFTVSFGLTQPGTAVALKVYVVLKSGRRAGSAPLVVRRPG